MEIGTGLAHRVPAQTPTLAIDGLLGSCGPTQSRNIVFGGWIISRGRDVCGQAERGGGVALRRRLEFEEAETLEFIGKTPGKILNE